MHWLESTMRQAASEGSLLLTVVSNLNAEQRRRGDKGRGDQERGGKGSGGGSGRLLEEGG